MADSVSTKLDLKADLQHGGTAGQLRLAATLGETRSRPGAVFSHVVKLPVNVDVDRRKRGWCATCTEALARPCRRTC